MKKITNRKLDLKPTSIKVLVDVQGGAIAPDLEDGAYRGVTTSCYASCRGGCA